MYLLYSFFVLSLARMDLIGESDLVVLLGRDNTERPHIKQIYFVLVTLYENP